MKNIYDLLLSMLTSKQSAPWYGVRTKLQPMLQSLVAMILFCLLTPRFSFAQITYNVDPGNIQHEVDERVYGHFLEHIFHSVNGGLWGELVWNRSMETASNSGGLWEIQDSSLVQSDLSTDVRFLFGETSWTDYEFTLKAKKLGGAEAFLIMFRADGGDYYWLNLGGWNNTQHAIEKATNNNRGVWNNSAFGGTLNTNQWYNIRIRCEGTSFKIYLDGALIYDVNDPQAHLSGQVGVGTWATQAAYKDFLVTEIPSGDTLFSGLPSPSMGSVTLPNWSSYGSAGMSRSSDALNSSFSVVIDNEQHAPAGIEQDAFFLTPQNYSGSFWAKGDVSDSLTVSLMNGSTILAEQKVGPLTGTWSEYPFNLTPSAGTSNGTLRISLPDSGVVYFDQVSMMGQDAIDNDGFRPDLFSAVEELRPPIIRWPGGYFAELYRWKDGIGPQHERGVYPLSVWDDQDVNSYGTDEFLKMCEKLDAEPIMVVNIGHRGSATPRQEYVEEVQHWIEYCNGDTTTTWGAIRAQNGHPEPYNIKMWEVSNEIWLTRGPEVYVDYLNVFVPAMKAVDSTIEIIACGSSAFDQNWNQVILNNCADLIDYISPHHYEGADNYASGVDAYENHIRGMKTRIANSSNPDIKIYMSEWNLWSPTDTRIGLYAGGMLNAFERQGDVFKIGAPALWLRHEVAGNQWDNALVNFNNTGWYPAPNYVVMKLWWDHYARYVIESSGGIHPNLDAVATLSEDSSMMVFKVVNTGGGSVPIALDIQSPYAPVQASVEQVASSSLFARNSLANPENISVTTGVATVNGQQVEVSVPRYSAMVVEVELSKSATGIQESALDYLDYSIYPNPTSGHTTFSFHLPQSEWVSLQIRDVMGRSVTNLADGQFAPGPQKIEWDGADATGSTLPVGIYYCELKTLSGTQSLKLILQ